MDKWEKKHVKHVAKYEAEIRRIYEQAMDEAALIMSMATFDASKPLVFSDYPLIQTLMTKLQHKMAASIEAVITKGIDTEWDLSAEETRELVESLYGDLDSELMELRTQAYLLRRDKAREAFKMRKERGLSLSDRVWQYTGQFKEELEMALDLGLRDGKSADELSREVRKYLNNPNMLFRRVRDEHGVLHLSKRAKAYHPGQGVYRSSYKNARRLTATETNMAYRSADFEHRQALDFVVGIKIQLSNNHTLNGEPFVDICDHLAGNYPKDFKFVGWHPLCRCFVTNIFKTKEESNEDIARMLRGEAPIPPEQSKNYVGDTPDQFKAWCRLNAGRVERAKSLPYFIRDNKGYYDAALNPKKAEELTPLEIAKYRHEQRTPEQIESIKNRWRKRQDMMASVNSTIPNIVYDNNWTDVEQVYDCDIRVDDPNTTIARDFDFVGFFSDLEGISSAKGITITEARLNVLRENLFDAEWIGVDEDGNEMALIRTFEKVNDILIAKHDYFDVPETKQGIGYSREVFKALYRQYQNMGVNRIEVHANINVGGYTWGRYGFSAKDRRNAMKALQRIGTDEYKKAVQIIDDYYTTHSLNDDAPFPMNLIASQPFGKDVLLDGDWFGFIDLTDNDARKYFEEYLGLIS